MTPFLQFALLLAIILFAAKAAGYVSTRFGQPSVLGELLIGILLGPSLVDILHLSLFPEHTLGEMVHLLAEMGVLLLMFIAGLELHLSELAHSGKVSALAGTLGVVVPVALGVGFGLLTGLNTHAAIFLGLTMGATSVSISAQTLIELKVLRSQVGLGLLGAAVFDDILVILLLSTFVALSSGASGGLTMVGLIFVRMVIFLAASVAIGLWVLPVLARRVASLPISQGVVALALVILLLYGVAAEVLGGMAAITGTFVAGLMFGRTHEKERLEGGVLALAYSFLVPIFFVNIGLSVNVQEMEASALVIFVGITVLAIAGKLLGCGLGARMAGFSWLESLQLGAGMVSRGEVGLIVAGVGMGQGLVSREEFAAIVGMVLVSTLVTPPMLRALFARSKAQALPAAAQATTHPSMTKGAE